MTPRNTRTDTASAIDGINVRDRIASLLAAGGELVELRDVEDDSALARLLGEACRRSPARLIAWLVATPGVEPVPDTGLFAFGFRRVFDCHEEGCHHSVYEFTLSGYKAPPDWLNSRFWANPERFDINPDDESNDS